jgi:hypothetical protein
MGYKLKPYQPTAFYVPKVKKHEESIQRRIATYLRTQYPDVDFHSDYAAGLKLTENQAKIRKSLNSGRGWSDLFIAYPSRGYHGLFIELKKEKVAIYVTKGPRKGELVKSEQIEIEARFLEKMNKLGYLARFGVGYDNTIKLINWYFGQESMKFDEF